MQIFEMRNNVIKQRLNILLSLLLLIFTLILVDFFLLSTSLFLLWKLLGHAGRVMLRLSFALPFFFLPSTFPPCFAPSALHQQLPCTPLTWALAPHYLSQLLLDAWG